MKLSYGVRGHYVSIPLEDRAIGPDHNGQFGDPCFNVPKHIVISGLIRPLYVREGTPLTIVEEGKGNLYVVSQHPIMIDYPVIEVPEDRLLRMVELISLSDPDAIIAVIPRLPSSCIGEYLRLLLVEEWRNNLEIMRHLRSIEMLCYQHTSEGKPVRGVFWIRGSYVRERVGQDWLKFSHPSIQCCDLAVSVGYHGIASDCPYNIGGDAALDTPPLYQGHLLGLTPQQIRHLRNFGLFNQLCNIANGVAMSHYMGRRLSTIGFLPHYNETRIVPLSEIIDVTMLKSTIRRGYRTVLTDEPSPPDIPPFSEELHLLFCHWGDAYRLLRNEDRPLWIGCSMRRVMSSIESMALLRTFQPSQGVREVVESIVSTLGDFTAIHLRLEDDWLSDMLCVAQSQSEAVTEMLWRAYTDAMKEIMSPEDTCYVCTHLGKSPNRNNYLLDNLREMYPRTITCPPWRDKYNLQVGREVDALIDYLVCLRASKFIGVNHSTFSITTSIILSSYGRKVILI